MYLGFDCINGKMQSCVTQRQDIFKDADVGQRALRVDDGVLVYWHCVELGSWWTNLGRGGQVAFQAGKARRAQTARERIERVLAYLHVGKAALGINGATISTFKFGTRTCL